jgi:hypothetical protein
MEAGRSSEMSVNIERDTQRHAAEDSNPHSIRCEVKLKKSSRQIHSFFSNPKPR